MSEPKLISPLLDNYVMGDIISERTGIRCCPALERDLQTKCIVKIISTPTSQAQLDALLLTGAYPDAQSALNYFHNVAEGIVEEAKILQRLSQLEGFFPYINWQLVPMADGVGFDIYTLSKYRKTLAKLLRSNTMTHLSALNLGLDLCTALAVCRRIGYLYVNLKPENIYLADNNTWKLGDIGFIQLASLKYASLPERYRSNYTAPEIADAFATLNTTLDVYALGLVLYRIFNGNQLPANLGNPENEPLLPPDFADYEMSEIILKACDPDPSKRWQDPIEMGQALVSYMQRNDVNDTPIAPTPIVAAPAPVAESPAEVHDTDVSDSAPELVDAEFVADSEDISHASGSCNESDRSDTPTFTPADSEADNDNAVLSEILSPSVDETAPEQNEDQLGDALVSDEVSDILSQADDLISHPTPDMTDLESQESEIDLTDESVATIPECDSAPTIDTNNTNNAKTEEMVSEPETGNNESSDVHSDDGAPAVIEPSVHEHTEENAENQPETPEESNSPTAGDTDIEDDEITEDDLDDFPDDKPTHWLRNLLIGAVVLIVAIAAFLFYTKYYLQTIDALDLTKSPNGDVTVYITTQTDESKLTVVCSDAYGNPKTAPVINGTAIFEGLAPGSAYTVEIRIDGFHSLKGQTTAAFTTPSQINVLQFNAITGNENGSVILSFTTKDQDSQSWTISYIADDGNQVVERFDGHTTTIYGLTVGNEYNFKLAPETDIKYTGITEVKHVASAVLIPQDLQIQSIADGRLTATWSAPTNANISKWIAHCYNESGYDQTVIVDTTSAVFENIDASVAYTVNVTAEGMSVSEHASSPANAITVTEFKATEEGSALILSWSCNNAESPNQWLLTYDVDGSALREVQCEDGSTVTLKDRIPGATYSFRLLTKDGVDVLGGRLVLKTAKAERFSGFSVKSSDMRFLLCRTPSKGNWSKKDLSNSDYTSTFKVGEKVSILAELTTKYKISKDSVTTMFVIRDTDGNVVEFSTSTRTWSQMWYQGLCEFDLSAIPQTAGKYTVSIYMNGKLAGENKITITE